MSYSSKILVIILIALSLLLIISLFYFWYYFSHLFLKLKKEKYQNLLLKYKDYNEKLKINFNQLSGFIKKESYLAKINDLYWDNEENFKLFKKQRHELEMIELRHKENHNLWNLDCFFKSWKTLKKLNFYNKKLKKNNKEIKKHCFDDFNIMKNYFEFLNKAKKIVLKLKKEYLNESIFQNINLMFLECEKLIEQGFDLLKFDNLKNQIKKELKNLLNFIFIFKKRNYLANKLKEIDKENQFDFLINDLKNKENQIDENDLEDIKKISQYYLNKDIKIQDFLFNVNEYLLNNKLLNLNISFENNYQYFLKLKKEINKDLKQKSLINLKIANKKNYEAKKQTLDTLISLAIENNIDFSFLDFKNQNEEMIDFALLYLSLKLYKKNFAKEILYSFGSKVSQNKMYNLIYQEILEAYKNEDYEKIIKILLIKMKESVN
ncbi:hypothetical protein [Mycoplasma struthionis]|uniref:Uncharacterized protein n=1 Tax=Mycoplasma struthionis TaxID=538220 RepID=A0A3G8LIV9_9MOLU|nr:hypothetical protein [Mycoplasma struthionis]AZG68598.1 hypothetical protein EGN60_01270 [Mycoplasma struthionis]